VIQTSPPPPKRPPARERILAASLEQMRRNGYAGTGVKAILVAAAAPFGSLYHHFPGGKEEVGAETIRRGGVAYRELVEAFYVDGADLGDVTQAFFDEAAAFVESTGFVDACPIATIAGEIAATSDTMRQAADEAFESWLRVMERQFVATGIDVGRARELSVELFCAIEGAFLLARTSHDAEPIRTVGRAVARSVREALAGARVPVR